TLYDPATGAFFGSQDADETYYPLPEEERALRETPSVDRTIFSEYNGKAVSGLVAAHRAFGAPAAGGGDSLLARAERLGSFLRERMASLEAGVARYLAPPGEEGKAPRRWLADHAAVATAYLDLHDATGKGEYLRWAEETLSDAISRLYRPEAAGFVDRLPSGADFGELSRPLYPFAPNAHIASALLRCARTTGREDLFTIGVRTLCGLSAEFDRRGAFAAPYGSALLLYTKGNPGTACLPGDPACS
ncbi:MAG: YyaL family protein, partial [Deltaproteobacteria bacterium]|nr:YyaL family protein [Deltaproteobacteria bacterium]